MEISHVLAFGNVFMTTGEGGMMVFQNPELVEIASSLRSHGMTNWPGTVLGALSYNVALGQIGWMIYEPVSVSRSCQNSNHL